MQAGGGVGDEETGIESRQGLSWEDGSVGAGLRRGSRRRVTNTRSGKDSYAVLSIGAVPVVAAVYGRRRSAVSSALVA